jgi:hypothetical protein
MTWICPKCGRDNRSEMAMCLCDYVNKTHEDVENYQSTVCSDRRMPIDSSDSIKIVAVGTFIFFIGLGIGASGIADLAEKPSDKFGNVFQIVVGLGFTIGGLLSFISVGQGQDYMETFKKGSTTTVATVRDRYTKVDYEPSGYGGGSSTTYYITVQFNAADRIYQIHAMVDESLYDKTDQERNVRVTYANSNPCILLFENEFKIKKMNH